MNDKIDLSRYALEVFEKSSDSIGMLKDYQGKLKGSIEILSKDIEALIKAIDNESSCKRELRNQLETIDDILNEIKIRLDASPFSKIVEIQQQSDKHFDIMFRNALEKLGVIQGAILETKKADIENRKEKWKYITALTLALFGIIGNIIQAIFK